MSNDYIAKVETIIRGVVKPSDMDMIVSNIGVYPDLSAIYTTNASMNTAFVQVSLKEEHSIPSYEYMRRVREKLSREMPELTAYFQAGGLVDGVINQGLPAPIDIQVSSMDMDGAYALAKDLSKQIEAMPNVSGVYIPQDIDYPGIALNIDREKASLIGLSAKEVVQNVITAMTSDGMVAPSYWIDPKSGNNYMVTVQYANSLINNMSMQDLDNIPLRGAHPAGNSPGQPGQEDSSAFAAVLERRPHCRIYATEFCRQYQADHDPDGSRSLPDSTRDRHLCFDANRGAARGRRQDQKALGEHQN